jgi:hypothetical protein
MRRILFSLVVLAIPTGLPAQGNPVSDAVRASAADEGKNLLAAARAMPADKYGYKPTPAQMTFGALIAHIEGDNRTTCTAIGGAPPPARPALTPSAGKEALVRALERSLDFCAAALARASDTRLGEMVPYYGHSAPRAAAMIGLVTDWADHYGQQAIYLRLNGVLPPTATRP